MNHPVSTLGLMAKTGRAIGIVLCGPISTPRVFQRYEIPLSSEQMPATIQPYHRVMELPWPNALTSVQPAIRAIEGLAEDSISALLRSASDAGFPIFAVGIVGSMGKDPARIGNPHIRAHAAEGQLFRAVLEAAASRLGIKHISFSPQSLATSASETLGFNVLALHARVYSLGKGRVQPWRIDERTATTAAWAALASAGPKRAGAA